MKNILERLIEQHRNIEKYHETGDENYLKGINILIPLCLVGVGDDQVSTRYILHNANSSVAESIRMSGLDPEAVRIINIGGDDVMSHLTHKEVDELINTKHKTQNGI